MLRFFAKRRLRIVRVVAALSASVVAIATLSCLHAPARDRAVAPALASSDGGTDVPSTAAGEADPCPSSWRAPPPSDPKLRVPLDGGVVLLRLAAGGTQNYECVTSPGGGTQWALRGPSATLTDCRGSVLGHHFASDAGNALPEWQTEDGTFVVAQKVASVVPDGGVPAVPWLLLRAARAGGAGVLSRTAYVHRLHTDGGLPSGVCRAGETKQVPYSADYFFYGP